MSLKTLTTPAAIAILVTGLAFSFWPVAALAHGGHGGHRGATTTTKTSVAAEATNATEGTLAPSERQTSRLDGGASPWLPVAFTLSSVVVLGGLVVILRRS